MHLLARIVLGTAALIPAAIAGHADPLAYDVVIGATPHGVTSTGLAGSPTSVSFTPTSFELGPVPVNTGGDLLAMYEGGDSGPQQSDLHRVPEPSSLALFGIGLLIGGGLIHRKLGGRRSLNLREESGALAAGARADRETETYDA